MKINDVSFLIFNSLQNNLLRSFLSCLGVFMGVFAVSGTLQVSDVGKTYLKKQLQEMESPQIFIYPPRNLITEQSEKYQIQDLELLKKNLSGWSYIIPLQNGGTGEIIYKKQKINVEAQAVTPNFLSVSGRKLIAGRFFDNNDLKKNYPVIVIDELTSKFLFKNQTALGKLIYFQNKSYYIKGIIQTKQKNVGDQRQGLVLMPLSIYQSLKSTPFFEQIIITPIHPENLEKVQEQAVQVLKKRFKNQDIYASSNFENVKMLEKALNALTIILLLIGGIALIVGGVGIANITIASVVERTSEIGLRRAVGATEKDILIQFLLESTIISMTGGIIAIVIVQGMIIVIVNLLALPYQFNYQTPLISLSSAIVVGVLASFLPAHRASKLDPVEALRSQ